MLPEWMKPATETLRAMRDLTPEGEAWHRMIAALMPAWTHFVTLTFSSYADRLRAEAAFYKWIYCVSRPYLRTHGVSANESRRSTIPYFAALEPHANGSMHIHAILAYVPDLDVEAALKLWRCGRAEIDMVKGESGRDPIGYLAKRAGRDGICLPPARTLINRNATPIPQLYAVLPASG
jgi:hypothetical protein